MSLGPPQCIVFLEPLFWFSLISAQPCRRFGSADLKKFISVPGILHKSSPVELELTIFWRQHCQGCTDMGPESVTVSEISEQCGYREASPIRPTRLCLQKLLILFVLPICSVLPPLPGEEAEQSPRPQPIPAAVCESVAHRSLCTHSSDEQHPQL